MEFTRAHVVAALASGVAIAVTGACSASSVKSCRVDAECGSGATCQRGACQAGLVVTILSPAGAVSTNSTVQVRVEVRGGEPAEVELRVDELELTKVQAPYEYAWDTRGAAEGLHRLWARVVAGDRVYESARAEVTVDRTAPPAPAVGAARPTNAPQVPVSGTAEAGATVTVYEGDSPLGEGRAGLDGGWTAAFPLAEGSHSLSAKASDAAGNLSPPSAPVVHVVDRTPPVVVTRVPAPLPAEGSDNIWSRDPISVTFSEPMRTDSVDAASVSFAAAGSLPLAKSLGWSADRRTLAIVPTTLPDPTTITVTLPPTLVDEAGNALTLPGDVWSWVLPEWHDLGVAGSWPFEYPGDFLLAAGPNGALAAGHWISPILIGPNSLVELWTGSAWDPPGGAAFPGSRSIDSVAVDGQGAPAIAWVDSSHVHAAKWNGSSWDPDDVLDVGTAGASSPSLGLDASGAPVVAWLERDGGSVQRVFVKRWNGSGWEQLGDAALNASATVSAQTPGVSFDAAGRPRVNWSEAGTTLQLATWSGSGWTTTPFGLSNAPGAGPISFAPTTGYPLLAWLDSSSSVSWLRVSTWATIHPVPTWEPLGGALNVDLSQGASDVALALGPDGAPVVAWAETLSAGGAAIYAKRWDGAAWRPLGGNAVQGLSWGFHGLAVASTTGEVAIAFTAGGSNTRPTLIHVRRYNH